MYERYVFRSRLQQQGESFDTFLTDLKIKAQSCNFGDLRDSMIRDQIVFGTNEKKLREKLLRETELTLESAIKIRAAQQENEAVNAVSIKRKPWSKFKNNDNKNKTYDNGMFTCKRCGEKHRPKQCPAYGKKCAKCKGQNHYAKMCLSKKKGQKIHTVQEDTDDSDDLSETFFIKMVSCEEDVSAQSSRINTGQSVGSVTDDKWTASLLVNETLVTFKIDTGAKANLINEKDFKALTEKPRRFTEKVTPLKAYNN
ncbi:complement component 3 [Sarotherodon galilaeus]